MFRREESVDPVNGPQLNSHEKRDFTRVLDAADPMNEDLRITSKPVLGDKKMIMPSDQTEKEKENRKAKRKFVRILKAAERHLIAFDVDYENHSARGFLVTKYGARQIILAFDAPKEALTLIVVLPTDVDLTMPMLLILLRLQNYTAAGSSSINFDPESSLVRVRSHAVLPDRSIVQPVVSSVLRDARNVLEDEDFRQFIN